MLDANDLGQLHSKFISLIPRCGPAREKHLVTTVETLGERLVMSPAGVSEKQVGAEPGAWLSTTIDVTRRMMRLKQSMEVEVPLESLYLVGMFHNLGFVGGPEPEQDYLLPESDPYKLRHGWRYSYNSALPKMSVAHRSLYLLQHFGVQLTMEEWMAIAICGGPQREENRFYVGAEPTLALLLSQARRWVFHNQDAS